LGAACTGFVRTLQLTVDFTISGGAGPSDVLPIPDQGGSRRHAEAVPRSAAAAETLRSDILRANLCVKNCHKERL